MSTHSTRTINATEMPPLLDAQRSRLVELIEALSDCVALNYAPKPEAIDELRAVERGALAVSGYARSLMQKLQGEHRG
jgi:hypothetical protein